MSKTLTGRLRDFASGCRGSMWQSRDDTISLMDEAAEEIERLTAIINRPENDDFVRGVSIEAEHQAQRWGDDHDIGKNGWDWFWTIGYLSQKATAAFEAGDYNKAKHHCVSTAALMKTMHGMVQRHEALAKSNDT